MPKMNLPSLIRRFACHVAALLLLASGAALAQAPAPAGDAASSPSLAASPTLATPAATKPPVMAPVPAVQANPYGLRALWEQGDLVARATLVVLVIMSLASWYVLITRLVAQARMGTQGKAAAANFWSADTVRQGADKLDKASPYRFIAESALEATRKHEGLIGQVDLNSWVTQSIERAVGTVHSRTQEGLAVLATVGSTAPFVGLLGTVWGIYHALIGIANAGQITIDKISGPVGEALIMTAAGLGVAIPAVLAYNVFGRQIGRIEADLEGFARDLRELLITQQTT